MMRGLGLPDQEIAPRGRLPAKPAKAVRQRTRWLCSGSVGPNHSVVDTTRLLGLPNCPSRMPFSLPPLVEYIMSNNQRRALGPVDTAQRTLGCRHSNPDICKNNMTDGKCAFVREDNICLIPPRSWARIFRELRGNRDTENGVFPS